MPAKVYDRPEGVSRNPLLIAVAVIVLLLLGYLIYRWQFAKPAANANSTGTATNTQSLLERKGHTYGLLASNL